MEIDQTPSFKEIEDPADRTDISNERFAEIGEGDFSGWIVPEVLDNRVAVVLVNLRVLGGGGSGIEELGELTDLAFVNRIV